MTIEANESSAVNQVFALDVVDNKAVIISKVLPEDDAFYPSLHEEAADQGIYAKVLIDSGDYDRVREGLEYLRDVIDSVEEVNANIPHDDDRRQIVIAVIGYDVNEEIAIKSFAVTADGDEISSGSIRMRIMRKARDHDLDDPMVTFVGDEAQMILEAMGSI